MLTRGARLAGLVPLVLAAAACAGTGVYGAAGGAGDNPGTPGGTATVALRVDRIGGFVTPAMLATRLPVLAVYSDGRVIDEGPQIEIFPPPALPNIQLRRISGADVRRLVDRAVASGVAAERDFGQPPIADAPSTRFTIQTADGIRTAEVPALLEADGSGLTAHQRSARRTARSLYDALTDLPGTLGAGSVSESRPYAPTAVAAISEPWTEPCSPSAPALSPSPASSAAASPAPGAAAGASPSAGGAPDGSCGADPTRQSPRPWPGPTLPGEPLGDGVGLSCVTADGDRATALLAAARTAATTTPWTSGGRQWRVSLRPLLPEESGCADLRAGG
nr:cold shock domain-containing protein [Frankia canadensis]